jgi:Delta24(24(1))-sterol reductase
MAFELLLAFIMPGYEQQGLPVPSLNYKTLTYHCNALSSFYATLVTTAALHMTHIFRVTDIMNNFGSMMTVAMIWGWAVSFLTYYITIWKGQQMRMSGNFFYDFWMGAPLNPRIGTIDLKMWAEVRIPWVLLFLISVSGACKQYEDYGYVTPVSSHFPYFLISHRDRTWHSWFSPLVSTSMHVRKVKSAFHKPGTCSMRSNIRYTING